MTTISTLQGGATVARVAHNHEVGGAIPSPATIFKKTAPLPVQRAVERESVQPGIAGVWFMYRAEKPAPSRATGESSNLNPNHL